MKMVEFGKVWKIETEADFLEAWNILEENEFCATMSDDFMRETDEQAEIQKQRKQVALAARACGLI